MRKNGTPGAFGSTGRITDRTASPTMAKPCRRPSTGAWCNHACPKCESEMARRAAVNSVRQTSQLAHMMRQSPRLAPR